MTWNKLAIAVVAVALAPIGWWWLNKAGGPWAERNLGQAQVTSGMPLVMPTTGGRLEISHLTVHERFSLKDAKRLLGLELPFGLGRSEVHLQARVVYRYYIDMEKQWPIQQHKDGRWIVRAGSVKPSLPVAFDTRQLEVFRQGVWTRIDGGTSLTELMRSMSPELEARAQSEGNRQLATEAGRKVVADFVRTWLLQNKHAGDPQKARVVVLFPGEKLDEPL
jgi:hypothetical protein